MWRCHSTGSWSGVLLSFTTTTTHTGAPSLTWAPRICLQGMSWDLKCGIRTATGTTTCWDNVSKFCLLESGRTSVSSSMVSCSTSLMLDVLRAWVEVPALTTNPHLWVRVWRVCMCPVMPNLFQSPSCWRWVCLWTKQPLGETRVKRLMWYKYPCLALLRFTKQHCSFN